MSNLEVICRLCDLLDRAQQIIRQQAELLSMHGVETDGKALERQRSEPLAAVERSIKGQDRAAGLPFYF